MKLTKRIAAIVLTVVMLSTCFVFNASAATTYNIDGGAVVYTQSTYKGYNNYILEFDPDDGYVPMAYCTFSSTYSSSTGTNVTVDKHVAAAQAEGYEVAGAINGSFFNMANGQGMCGILINEGRVVSADASVDWDSIATFDLEGKFTRVDSCLNYSMKVNGTAVGASDVNVLGSVNKNYGRISYVSMNNKVLYYDSCATSGITSSSTAGYEILCNKLDYTELVVGGTLKAEVVSVTKGYYGKTIPTNDNQFVLFVRDSSSCSYRDTFKNLSSGASIEISITEANGTYQQNVLKNCYSGISSAYWLVDNGVDNTDTSAEIGHSVTLRRAWTAFGIKADGSYVFWINKEYGNTLREVADKMQELGCVNVIRLDGGGSSAMYVNGKNMVYEAESGGRKVCDALLIVKKTSMNDETLDAELQAKINEAKPMAESNAAIAAMVNEATALLTANGACTEVRAMLQKFTPEAILSALVDQAYAESPDNFTEADYGELMMIAESAKSELESGNISDTNIKQYTQILAELLNKSTYTVLSLGAEYTHTVSSRTDVHSVKRNNLTDGSKSNNCGEPNGCLESACNYSGWTNQNPEITVNLGSAVTSNAYSVYMAGGFWGVHAPYEGLVTFKMEYSNDGINFTEISVTTTFEMLEQYSGTGCKAGRYTMKTPNDITAQYIRFTINGNVEHKWVDEVEVAYSTGIPSSGGNGTVVDGIIYGDVNMSYNGNNAATAVNISDCILIKRYILGTYQFNDDQFLRGDINGSNSINISDYILCKRIILGTYSK